jgi:alkylation response protein AidB-like acyl-CoA dehydrogenase
MMDFKLSEDQEMLRSLAKDFLTKECPKAKVRELEADEKGYDPQMWEKMAGLGWLGLVFPEKYGGTGASFLDLVLLMEEIGRNILPGPFFSTATCALPILEYGDEELKAKFLPQIANGAAIWILALIETLGGYKASEIKTSARVEDREYVIEGTKLFVPNANIASHLLVAAQTGEGDKGITMFIVDARSPGVEVEVIPTIAQDKQCQVTFSKVRVPEGNVLGDVGRGWSIVEFILDRAAILKCAEVSGGCQAVVEMTNAYAKDRVQFDKPIGSFQAIQHRLVDMFVNVEGLQYLLYQAAWEISVGSPSKLHISLVKAKASEVYQQVCLDAIKIHGATGFTREHDVGLYFRRVKAAEFSMGDTDLWREKVAVELRL